VFFLLYAIVGALRPHVPAFQVTGVQANRMDAQIFGVGWAIAVLTGILIAEW
jgi:hypothetical protein